MRRSCLVIVFTILAGLLAAEPVSVRLSPGVDLDEAGRSLRMAINAYEEALKSPLPDAWSRLSMRPDESLSFGKGLFLLAIRAGAQDATLMFIDEEGPHRADLASGNQVALGTIDVILVTTREDASIEILFRRHDRVPPLQPTKPGEKSPTRISGVVSPPEIIVQSPSPQTAAFAEAFLLEYNRTQDAMAAAEKAREAVPIAFEATPHELIDGGHGDPYESIQAYEDQQPLSALVTLHLVRGEASALKALSTKVTYRSDGSSPDDPSVRVSGGGRGLGVGVGNAGDRFRGRLRALESEGQVQSQSETFVRVPLGGESLLRLDGPSGYLEAWVSARPSGRGVLLDLDQRSGNWSFLGGVSTSVRIRDGETVTLARNISTRTTSSSSGPPIVGGIPYVGPLLGSSSRTSRESSYALYATVELE
ncbi:hypothetical protein KQI84_00225 [bacterium]|nr:hypothetical protein [bacterium]